MYYLIAAAAWLAVLGYFVWRIQTCRRKLVPVRQEISWAVYLLTAPLLVAVWALFPNLSQAGSAVVFVAWLAASGFISYKLNRRFNDWIEEELKRKKEEERWSG